MQFLVLTKIQVCTDIQTKPKFYLLTFNLLTYYKLLS